MSSNIAANDPGERAGPRRAPAATGNDGAAPSRPFGAWRRVVAWLGALSIAWRLVLAHSVLTCLITAGAMGALHWNLSAAMDRQSDDFLEDVVQVVRMLSRTAPDDLSELRHETEVEWSAMKNAPIYARVISPEGAVLAETPRMAALLPPAAFPSAASPHEPLTGGVDVRGSDGAVYRLMAGLAPLGTDEGGPARVAQVAVGRAASLELLADFRRRMAALFVVVALLSPGVGLVIARLGLRPVQEISRAMGRVGTATLGERLACSGQPAEIRGLASRFNEMLDRLEDAFSRVSRFSSDIAHEMRTPISNLRGEAEVALQKSRTVEQYRAALESNLEECARLARLIDGLLVLARAENPNAMIHREPVDLRRELEIVRDYYLAVAEESGVDLAIEAPDAVLSRVDRTLLQRALSNLVENALEHTFSGGRVALRAAAAGGGARVEVADTGAGIPREHLPYVFDRLYRVDRARAGDATRRHAGLGLAIVKSVAELHGGEASLFSEPGAGTRVALTLPDER